MDIFLSVAPFRVIQVSKFLVFSDLSSGANLFLFGNSWFSGIVISCDVCLRGSGVHRDSEPRQVRALPELSGARFEGKLTTCYE